MIKKQVFRITCTHLERRMSSGATPDYTAKKHWFRAASDQSLLLYFDNVITLDAHRKVARMIHLLEAEPIPGVVNLHPAYCSVLFKFDGLRVTHEALEIIIDTYLDRLDSVQLPEPREVEIPVCYDAEFGPDLNDVA